MVLHALIGVRIHGWLNSALGAVAIFGTISGIASTLGVGAAQMNTGCDQRTGFGVSIPHQLGIITLVTCIATLSMASRVRSGARLLSVGNFQRSNLLLAFLPVFAPTAYLFRFRVRSMGIVPPRFRLN